LASASAQASPGKPSTSRANAAPATSGTVVPLVESFEDGLGAFDTSSNGGCGCAWSSVTTDHHTGTHAAYAPDVAVVSDDQLYSRYALEIPANATSASLTFWHRFDFENDQFYGYDGGVLEASTDRGTTWA